MVADTRVCEQCGTSFVPRREHARFCSPSCRAAWNREHTGDLKAGISALQWSITAMNDTIRRLALVTASDQAGGFTVISEAVWWVTMVDATLVRHHLDAYDAVLAGQAPTERHLIDDTLAGLRFVRNRIGDEADLAEFIERSPPARGSANGHVTGWTWKPVPEPAPRRVSSRGQPWEIARHQAYQSRLAHRAIGETFTRAQAFLILAADTPVLASATEPAPR